MSRGLIYQVHIADGFADDCEELIQRWLKTDTLTYETFCEIWKDMKFGFLYHGRTCGAEMAELSEEMIHIAKHYMVANTSYFEESVAGVFLVYALVNLQPYPGFASLRIIPEDVPAINRIEMVARRQKRYDVLYILGSLLTEGPVQYHAVARERGMESGIRKYLEGFRSIDTLGVRPRGVFFRQNEELDLLRELACITRRYHGAKRAIKGVNNHDLNYTSETLPSELDASLKKIINGILETTEVSEESTVVTRSMQAIKEKAMKLSVDGVSFLKSAVAENNSPEKRIPKVQCEIKQKPGKIRQGSPKKPVTSLAKRKIIGKMPKRKRKRTNSSNSSSELATSSDKCVNPEVSNSNPVEQSNVNEVVDDNDLNIESFNKEQTGDNVEAEEREIHITIDSLPVFITEEQSGKMFEIEIIDNLKSKIKEEKVDNVEEKLKKLDGITFNKVGGTEENTLVTPGSSGSSYTVKNLKEIEENTSSGVLKRPEKRDLKKTLMKSKFKRMGMLSVANFEESDNTTTEK